MTEKLIPYRVNGEMFDVPESSREKFEKRYPSATIEMHVGDEIFDVPFAQEGAFIKRYPDAVYGLKPSETNPEEISSPVSIDDVEMNRKERRQARREERANDDKTSLGETLVKSTGAAGTMFAKQALDLGRMAWNSSAIGGAINMLTGNSYDEKLQDEDNLMTQWSTKLGETADRLSLEADPTGGKEGYLDLIKQGRLGTVLQKAVGSGIESIPMMLAASNPLTAVAYGAAMAESEYADETRENPEVAAWKRRVNATGQAALELAIERLGGPFKAKGKLTKETLEKFLGEAAKEGAETIAKRIFKGLGGVLKEGGEEGLEELGTSFGNDILGTALDAVDGNADYGIRAQWEQAKAENPNLTLGEFARMKGKEYIDSFIGGAVSGMEISGTVGGARKGYSLIKGETRNAVQAARDNGANLDYANMYDTDALVAESATALEGALVDKDGNPIVDRAFIDNISANEAYALAGREGFSNEQRKAFFDYAVAKAQSDGLNEKLDNRLNEQIEGVRGRIEEATDDNGLVIVGTLNGKAVYVKDGFITTDGRVATGQTDTGYTFGPVIVVDSVTGEKTTITGDQIQSASSHVASELFGGMEAAFREKEANERNIARNTVSPRAKLNTVIGLQNRKMLVDLGNGLIEVEVMKVDPMTGEVMINGKKGDLGGQAITKLGTDVFYDSLYRDENGEFAFVDEIDTPTEPEDVLTDIPVAPETTVEEGPAAETPAEVTETPDYRGETFTILQNGVPVEAEVVSQDDASDTVVYRIIGENGQPMLLSSSIGEFGSAIEAAATQVPAAPKVETEPEVETAPETPAGVETAPEAPAAPIEPEAIDWDALFDSDQEAYFAELQNQFGEEALDILNEEIEAAQNELDALAKAKTKTQNERLENRKRKAALQSKIEALNGMVARLAPPAAPASPEVTPEVPTAPVAPTVPQGVENVPDFSIDKASEARKRGFRMTNGQRVDRRGETSGVYGKDIEVTFTSESKGKRGGKVKVIEAGSLVPSHIGGVENVYHFLPEAQPKKRTDAASTVSATLIAQNMDSAKMTNVSSSAYEGAPSVNKRGEAIQGNNRAAAIIEMYQAYPEKAAEYKQYLIDHSAEFGIDAATVATMQNPVLVRELDVDDTDAIALGQHTMQDMESGGSQMIDSGRAIAGLSNKGLLEEFIARLLAEENEEASDMNLNDLITRNGNDAIKMLYHNGIINQTQYQSALGPNGKVTADARASLRGIIEQQLFANGIDNLSVMFEVLPDKAKKAIMQTIARDLKNPEDSKVTPYIQEAIEIYYQLNKLPDFVSAKTDAEIDSAIESFKAQTSLDQDGVPAEKYTNFAFVLARNFKAKTQKQQRELLNYLYDTIEGTADIFGESEGKSLGEAVAEVYNTNLNKAKDETDEEGGTPVLEGGTGEGPEGRQGSTGGVGVRPTTGEGGQGAGNGGTDTTFGGGVGSEGEVSPKAPKPVDNPVAEAQKKEKSLAIQLKRIGIPHEQKQDMAFNAGKAVADFFATREEYEAYAENATDFGEYNADFERGVDASFANRPQSTGVTTGNSVPLENEPKGEDNGKANEPETEDTEGRVDRIGSEPSNDEGSEESGTPSEEVGGSEADNTGQVEDKYPARTGDVTPQILKETFGMRDVASDISTDNLNSIYDFMMEMAKILGISPKSIGHGATLGAENYNSPNTHIRAQYSYRQAFDGTVKNPVLRFRNAALSSIAHEWWHSLDTALAYYETGKTHHTATNSNDSNFTGRAETLKAVKDVLKAINKSGHKDRLNIELANNPSYLKYSKQKDEMSARAFEEYILMKFAEAGIEVDTHTAFFSNRPNAEEMKVIAPAFDKLFEVLQEKEGKTPGTSVLFQIGQEVDEKIEENNTSEVARKLANEAIDIMFEQAGREVVFVTDEQAEQMRRLAGANAEFMIDSDKPVFVSNAAVAVMDIKQEKATPAQWLAMIDKAGGLKAGEDKWMGLSDWLKASDKKTLTKQEVLDYIADNTIQIEEQHYLEDAEIEAEEQKQIDAIKDEFFAFRSEAEASGEYINDAGDIAYQQMVEKYGDDFAIGFGVDMGKLYVSNLDAAASITGIQPRSERYINETRAAYTTDGLTNKREIALIVPTIESWGQYDEVHFGDAGDGRAIAWVRFGETYINEEADAAYEQAKREEEEFRSQMEQKYGSLANGMRSTLTEEEYAHYMNLVNRTIQLNESKKTAKEKRILVIDEIQSNRHQEGRERGYKSPRPTKETERLKALNAKISELREQQAHINDEIAREKENEDIELARIDALLDDVMNISQYDELTRMRENIERKRSMREDALYVIKNEIMLTQSAIWDEEGKIGRAEIQWIEDNKKKVADAPFDKNWHELAMKRMLRYAAEHGYDAIAWTKGEQQAERYGIGNVVTAVDYRLNDDGTYRVDTMSALGYQIENVPTTFTNEQELADVFGKEIAKKIVSDLEGKKADIESADREALELREKMRKVEDKDSAEYEALIVEFAKISEKRANAEKGGSLSETDFRIGGEGMKGFYDKMLPAFMNKYGKKWGIKVADITLPNVEEAGQVMHSVPVTDAMKESVMEGQVMFMKRPNGKVFGWTDGKKIYLTKDGLNPNTKIHEYTHLWAQAMMQKNPKGWQSVKDLLRGTPVWNEVLNDPNYSNIHADEDLVASEVLSRISGRDGSAKLERMAQQMVDEAKGSMRKLEARGLVQRIKDALNEFWNWVGTELFGIEKFESVEQVTDRVLWDLMNATELGELSEGQVETQIVTDPNVIAELEASPNSISNENSVSLPNDENSGDTYTDNDSRGMESEAEGVQSKESASGPLSDGRRLYDPEGEGISWDAYTSFNPISKREGESDRQRDIRETRFLESFEKLTSDERILLYTFLSEYLPKNSGVLKSRTDAFVQSIDNAEFAQFVEDFVNDELNYREGLASAAVAKHGLIVGVNQGLAAVERMFYAFNEDEYNGTLFDRAIKLAKRFGVSVKFATRNPDGSFFNAYGSYNPNDNSITLDASLLLKGNEQELCKTIVHELLHSVVARAASIMSGRAVGADGQFIDPQSLPKNVIDGINTLKEVYDAIKDDGTFQDTYGATSFEEMISEISDPKFRALLKAKSLWKKFLNGVCRILGIADKSTTESDALTEIESALDQIFASAENGELDTLYASYLGQLADGYTLEDLQQLADGDVKALLTNNALFRTGIDPTETAREAAKAVYDKVVNDTWQEMQRQFQDAYQPVRIAIDAIQQETGNIPIEDYENYLLIQNQSSSRSRVEIDEFAERYYSPIVEQVNKIIDTIMEDRRWKVNDADRRAGVYGELKQYLIAKHGLERNEYYQTHKMRNLTAAEKRKEKAIAKQAYDTEVANINADTTLTDAERELQLRDAKDAYDAAILEINTREVPDIRDYSGLTSLFGLEPKKFRQAEAEARNLVDNAENMFGPELDILWERINKATDKTLRHSYESGIISRQQYNDIKDMFEFYIPLRGFEDITAEEIYSYARFEGNRFSPAVQTAKGRTSVANDPLAYIMSMAESEITQGNKNRAKQALYNYLLNRTQTDADGNQIQNSLMQVESVWYVKSVDASGNTVMTMAAPDHASGEAYEEFEARMEALAATGDAVKSKKGKIDIGMRFQKPANMGAHYVHLKVNGVDKAIYINGDPKAADAINGTYKKERNELSEAMGKWNRFLSSMFTNYSLEFTVRNYFRDMLYSHINIGIKESDPAYRKKFRQNWRHNNFGSMVKMLKAFRAGEFEGRALTEDEAAFVEFMKNGGQTGYVVLNKVETHRAELEKAIERMQKGLSKGGVKDSTVFKYTLGGIELLNEASELVTRFAAFKTSRDMGRSVVQSISDAKEVTVNFNTKGAQDGKGFMGMIAHYFGWSKYFFNASMQGVQNLKAMANANKLKFGGVVGGIVATGFLMPIITGAIAQLLGGDEEEYWNIPEYDRQNNFCIPVGNGKYAKIPLPVGFREVYAIGDMVSAMMFDKKFTKDVKSVGTDIANKIASIVLPINPLEGTANGLSIWHTLAYTAAPSSAQLLIQNLTNTDWKGAPLQKEYTYNENDPQWMKAFAGNPDWMRMLSKWCNEHINADGDYKGWDWSPEKLDNTLSNLFGGVYTLIKKTGKSISMIWNEENRNMQNAPVAGVFLGSGIDSDDRFVTDAYYEMMDYYDSQVGYIKRSAARFGYDLDEVFNKEKGKHHPKMNEIYSNKNFDFMQEWYKGNEDLEKLNDKIKRLEKKIAGKENPTESDLNKLARLKDQLAVERREFVDDMLELD